MCLVSFIIPDSVIPAVYKFMWPFFLLGYTFNKYDLKEKLKKFYFNKIFIVSCFVIFIILLRNYNYNTFIYTSGFYILDKYPLMHIDNNILRFLVGVFGSLSIMYLVYGILKVTPDILKNSFACLGKYTLGIYIISNYLFDEVFKIIPISGINYFYILIESISVLAISFSLTFLFKKYKITNRLFLGGR